MVECCCYSEDVVLDGDAAVQDSLQAGKAGRPQAKRADGARRVRTARNAIRPGWLSFRGRGGQGFALANSLCAPRVLGGGEGGEWALRGAAAWAGRRATGQDRTGQGRAGQDRSCQDCAATVMLRNVDACRPMVDEAVLQAGKAGAL